MSIFMLKKSNKALAVPLSRDRNNAHHHYNTVDTALMASVGAKLNLFRTSALDKTGELSD